MNRRSRLFAGCVAVQLIFSHYATPVFAQATVERPTSVAPVKVQLDAIPTGSLVVMLMRDIMRVPYVIAPDVLADRRPTSVNLIMPRHQVAERVVGHLRRTGFTVELSGGTVYVGRKGSRFVAASAPAPAEPMVFRDGAVPVGSPLDPSPAKLPYRVSEPQGDAPVPSYPEPPPPSPDELLGYSPAHRDPSYFSSIIGPLLPGLKFGARSDVKASPSEQDIAPRDGPDVLIMAGSADDLARARRLIETLDRPRPMVAVKAVVMQVQNIQARGSALSVLASLTVGDGKLQIGSFPGAPTAAQFVRIASGAFSAVLSAVREDSRFKVVATPNLAALSGGVATMNAGSQVPTVGAVTIAEGGTPVQSVIYRDSGITLAVRPVVRGELIELDVREERSTFVRTTTGVEDSPTLQKSTASASVMLKSGESVVLAGLSEQSTGNRKEGIFGGLLGVRSRDNSDSELLVLLQAELVPLPVVPGGTWIDLGEPAKAVDLDA